MTHFDSLSDYSQKAFNSIFDYVERGLDKEDLGDLAEVTQGDVTAERMDMLNDDDRCDDLVVDLLECDRARELVRAISSGDFKTVKEIYEGVANKAAINAIEERE